MDYSYICAVQPTILGGKDKEERGKMEEDKKGQGKYNLLKSCPFSY